MFPLSTAVNVTLEPGIQPYDELVKRFFLGEESRLFFFSHQPIHENEKKKNNQHLQL